MMSSQPIVLYLGPSILDPQTDVVVLATVNSKNRKTGLMIQTWIVPLVGPLRSSLEGKTPSSFERQTPFALEDKTPFAKPNTDYSVCGDCPRRRSLGGDCYVRLDAAPHSAWKKWVRAGKPGENWSNEIQVKLLQKEAAYGLRLGSYGDPAAVPAHVWVDLIDAIQPSKTVGYTHQWRRSIAQLLRGIVMASCDNVADTVDAHHAGWRYFVATTAVEVTSFAGTSVQCLADRSDKTCADCGACNGARLDRLTQPASIWIAEHGPMTSAKIRRSAMLNVL